MNDLKKQKPGGGVLNANKPFGNNPYIQIPPDVDRNPFRLVWIDILSVFEYSKLLPLVFIPLRPCISGTLDELSATWPNIRDILLQALLFISQLLLLLALPIVTVIYWFVPGVVHMVFCVLFTVLTLFVMRLLNGGPRTECLVGLPEDKPPVNDETELWFFINGIATGYFLFTSLQQNNLTLNPSEHWLQSNLNLLASTFQREIVGIHNSTKGFLFDLIECLIQRDLDYKTKDIRQGRMQLRSALSSHTTHKVVLILHSQGGIEGSSILDWLFADLSFSLTSKLEIFTFGNAARHFNNPLLKISKDEDGRDSRGERVVKHIEHYANSEDFVANIGVLNFTSPQAQPYADGNAFYGPVFIRKGSGHLLNMHYLDNMFTRVNGRVVDGNTFMDSLVSNTTARETPEGFLNGFKGINEHNQKRLKDISRLWQYRNGGNPEN